MPQLSPAVRRLPTAALAFLAGAFPLQAQAPAGPDGRGVILADALDPRAAADRFEAALASDSTNGEANWRAALALIDIGKQTPDTVPSATRDSLYRLAERYARRATLMAPDDPNAHFALAMALGKAALTRGKRERVAYAVEIREEALRTLSLDSRHDGAYHVLGRWHAEIERLSNIEEFFAKKFLGAKVFGEASWGEAAHNLETAILLRPEFIYHRLGLAEIYVDMKRYAAARTQLEAIPALPTRDVMDPTYRRQAEALLRRIAGKTGD